ncbi:MAG: hypothetical protein K6C36_10115, partial [Clostridia bacterium]|nr:hypothetical protein [Clostridia bacterium]
QKEIRKRQPMSVLEDFQKAYPTKALKEQALRQMSDSQIDRLIKAASGPYAMIFMPGSSQIKKQKIESDIAL